MAKTKRICAVEGCCKTVHGRRLCPKHRKRLQVHGSVNIVMKGGPKKRINRMRSCKAIGCGKEYEIGKGSVDYCSLHYRRFLRHGDPNGGRTKNFSLGEWITENINHKGQDCLIWPFARSQLGYPILGNGYETRSASRLMCIRSNGQPPSKKMQAAHNCGNGHLGCMNPRHLRWATCSENNADKIIHGTHLKGQKIGNSKLSDNDVLEIRRSSDTGVSLAKEYGVSTSTISMIKSRKVWAWL